MDTFYNNTVGIKRKVLAYPDYRYIQYELIVHNVVLAVILN